jgi:GrpB-like predicted nucleotidyltransferase (UPF0157 family)
MTDSIIIVDYNPHWPQLFAEEQALIRQTVGDLLLRIEHVGSTAVPGLGAKPIIDIAATAHNLVEVVAQAELFQTIGYLYMPEYEAFIPERRYFRKGFPARTHHLHVVAPDSAFWKRHLAFRDYLRAHPEIARDYYELKLKLAAQYGADRDGYTNAKTEFIRSIEAKAMAN